MKAESSNPLFESPRGHRQHNKPRVRGMAHTRQGSDRSALLKPGSLRTRLANYCRAIQRLNEPQPGHRRSSTFTSLFGGLSGSGIPRKDEEFDESEHEVNDESNRGYNVNLEEASAAAYPSDTEQLQPKSKRSPSEIARMSFGFLRRQQSSSAGSSASATTENTTEDETERARGVVGAIAMGEDSDEERAINALLADDPMYEDVSSSDFEWSDDAGASEDQQYDDECSSSSSSSSSSDDSEQENEESVDLFSKESASSSTQSESGTPSVLDYELATEASRGRSDVESGIVLQYDMEETELESSDLGKKNIVASVDGTSAEGHATVQHVFDIDSGSEADSESDYTDSEIDVRAATSFTPVRKVAAVVTTKKPIYRTRQDSAPTVLFVDSVDSSDDEDEMPKVRFRNELVRATPRDSVSLISRQTVRIVPSLPEIEALLDEEAAREAAASSLSEWDDPMLEAGFDLDEADCPILAVQFLGADNSLAGIQEEEHKDEQPTFESTAATSMEENSDDQNQLDWDKWWKWMVEKIEREGGDWNEADADIPFSLCRETHSNSALNENPDRAMFRQLLWCDTYEEFADDDQEDSVTVGTSRSALSRRLSRMDSKEQPMMMVGHIPDSDSEEDEMAEVEEVFEVENVPDSGEVEIPLEEQDDPVFDSLRLGSGYSISIGSQFADRGSNASSSSSIGDDLRSRSSGSSGEQTKSSKVSRKVSFCTKPVVLVSYEYEPEIEDQPHLKQVESPELRAARWSENPKYGTEEYGMDGWV